MLGASLRSTANRTAWSSLCRLTWLMKLSSDVIVAVPFRRSGAFRYSSVSALIDFSSRPPLWLGTLAALMPPMSTISTLPSLSARSIAACTSPTCFPFSVVALLAISCLLSLGRTSLCVPYDALFAADVARRPLRAHVAQPEPQLLRVLVDDVGVLVLPEHRARAVWHRLFRGDGVRHREDVVFGRTSA